MCGGGFPAVDLAWAVDGSGPAGGLFLRKRGGWSCLVGLLLAGVVGCLCWYRKHARCCLVWVVVGVPVRACVRVGVACCRGSGVVRPGCLACGSASLLWGGVVGVGGLVVNCIVDASIITVCFCDCGMRAFCLCVLLFVFLSVRWMPWHQGPMKDVVACDIPRGAGWRAVIRGFPNGGTRHELCRVTCI